jgi:hypothetical protein
MHASWVWRRWLSLHSLPEHNKCNTFTLVSLSLSHWNCMCVRYVNFFHVCRFSDSSREHHTPTIFSTLSLSFHTPPHILSACTQRLHPILFALNAFECEKRFSAADDIGAAGVGKRMGLMHFFIRQISTVAAHYHLPEPLFEQLKALHHYFILCRELPPCILLLRKVHPSRFLCAPGLDIQEGTPHSLMEWKVKNLALAFPSCSLHKPCQWKIKIYQGTNKKNYFTLTSSFSDWRTWSMQFTVLQCLFCATN